MTGESTLSRTTWKGRSGFPGVPRFERSVQSGSSVWEYNASVRDAVTVRRAASTCDAASVIGTTATAATVKPHPLIVRPPRVPDSVRAHSPGITLPQYRPKGQAERKVRDCAES